MIEPDKISMIFEIDRLRELVDKLEWEKKALQAKHDELLKTATKLVSFLMEGLETTWNGFDWEGDSIQESAENLELIQIVSEDQQNDEFGVFYDYAPEIKNLMSDRK
jgi:hypothetical protein